MGTHVNGEVTRLSETSRAFLAGIRFLVGVNAFMNCEIPLSEEFRGTVLTRERSLPRMQTQMLREASWAREYFATLDARTGFHLAYLEKRILLNRLALQNSFSAPDTVA